MPLKQNGRSSGNVCGSASVLLKPRNTHDQYAVAVGKNGTVRPFAAEGFMYLYGIESFRIFPDTSVYFIQGKWFSDTSTYYHIPDTSTLGHSRYFQSLMIHRGTHQYNT